MNSMVFASRYPECQISRYPATRTREYGDRIGFALAWLVVFSIPWGDMVQLTYDVQGSRVLAAAVAVFVGLSHWRTGRLKPLNASHWWMILFVAWTAASVAWTPEPDRSIRRILSYYQLFCAVWLLHQCGHSFERHCRMLLAYVLGCFVVFGGLMYNFLRDVYQGDGRYTAPGLDPNDLAITLILAIPVAWYLSIRMKSWRWMNRLYIPCAVLAALLTASRAGLVTLAVVLLFPLLSLPRSSIKVISSLVVIAALSGMTVTFFMNEISIRRLSTITEQLTTRDLNGRGNIWERGIEAFGEHPLAGTGGGTFANAIGARRSREIAAHNSFLGVLVEHGLIGLCLLLGVVFSLFRRACRRPPVECRMWLVVLAGWMVAASTLSWENKEITWLLWGLCASQPVLMVSRTKPNRGRSYGILPSGA